MIWGEKIGLRAIEPEDAERCHRWVNDPEVIQFLTMRVPISLAAERTWTESRPDASRELHLAIETLDGQHIGNCGLHGIDQLNRDAELGILIGEKAFWSKGYGTDTILTLCSFGFCQLNLHRIHLRVWEFNERGIHCYEKCGLTHEGRLREGLYRHGRWQDVLLMGILADEFRAKFPERWGSGLRAESK